MFLGSYKPSFDSKSRRIALPKKIRDYLETNEVVLSFGFEKCIFGYAFKAWEKESKKQLEAPITDTKARDIRRFLFSAAERLTLDDQGRFVIPLHLLEYAQIKEPVVIGSGDHFEIWESHNWQIHKGKLERKSL
jgi:MraZ protein